MIPIELLLSASAAFLLLSIFASKVAGRFGVPALLLFLVLGMLAGSDGPGRIYFDFPWAAQSIGVVALAFILFSGGLDTSWRDVQVAVRPALMLSTLGVGITALAVGLFATLALGLTVQEGILLGAIIGSTDAAAVFSVLRGRGVQLRGRLKPVLELESGSNDPMAVFLTISMITLITQPGLSALSLIPMFIQQMALGALLGLGGGWIMLRLINRLRLEYDGLYPVLSVSCVLLTYGLTAMIGGNGFLAVYLAGLMLARADFIHKRSLRQFHDGIAWLMQIIMFVTLGLQVFPSQLPAIAGSGLLTAAFLILIARPLSVFLALAFSRFSLREKLFISWVGLRGAAPIVLATFPVVAGIGQANTLFNLVFFIVLTSVLLQGALIVPAARLLGLQSSRPALRSPLAYVMRDDVIANNLIEVSLPEEAAAIGRQIIDIGLPQDTLIVLIGREGDMVVPRGSTILQANDRLLLLTSERARPQVEAALGCSLGAAGGSA
jgi:cell volume regulation protein A